MFNFWLSVNSKGQNVIYFEKEGSVSTILISELPVFESESAKFEFCIRELKTAKLIEDVEAKLVLN